MSKNTTQIGKKGEEMAKKYLQENNYVIVAQNYRYLKGEIDIIAKKIDKKKEIENQQMENQKIDNKQTQNQQEQAENQKVFNQNNQIFEVETLVFVEVKFRKNNDFGFPEQSVTPKKMALIKKTADFYLQNIQWQHHVRFDIIAITQTKQGKDIFHFEDCF